MATWQACAIFVVIVGVSACLVEEVGVCRDIYCIFVGVFSLFLSLSYVICMKRALYVLKRTLYVIKRSGVGGGER